MFNVLPVCTPLSEHFWKMTCSKSVRRCFRSQNVQNTSASDHFWKFRCRKNTCHGGAKQISKSKVLKLTVSDHFWTFRCRFAWQAQGMAHPATKKSCQVVRIAAPVTPNQLSKLEDPMLQNANLSQEISTLTS